MTAENPVGTKSEFPCRPFEPIQKWCGTWATSPSCFLAVSLNSRQLQEHTTFLADDGRLGN
jgi:hypothetical protein